MMAGVSEKSVANTWWFHMFRSMFDAGDVAKIGPYAFTVYAVIKSHAGFHNGIAFPGIEVISKQSGVSIAQVKRSLQVLQNAGFISIARPGRSNRYTLHERVQITAPDGCPEAVASWDYTPDGVQRAVAELKKLLTAGDLGGAKVLKIQNLAVQINVGNVGGENTLLNMDSLVADLDRLPAQTREKLLRRLKVDQVINSSD